MGRWANDSPARSASASPRQSPRASSSAATASAGSASSARAHSPSKRRRSSSSGPMWTTYPGGRVSIASSPSAQAQLGDLAVNLRHRGRRGVAGIELVRDSVDRDHPTGLEQQQREDRALDTPAKRDLFAVAKRLQRAEDANEITAGR